MKHSTYTLTYCILAIQYNNKRLNRGQLHVVSSRNYDKKLHTIVCVWNLVMSVGGIFV